ncbi:MAG TPA: alcohol dehydrogenase catalytic domain-containing protein [Blastocatellia bacterium]|nr:alcohol dehydrogenase catalytic domain-containing protein [Blastocatellia bacterium]
MQALTVTAPEQIELRDIPQPVPGAREVLLRTDGVGLCGTDFHIYEGRANYHTDAAGRPIPLNEQPQILGHEFCGTVVETGSRVRDLKPGDRVIADQGLNCSSRAAAVLCEYCATGNTHQCADYAEHGITGLQGAMAEFIAVPAVNAVRIESNLPPDEAALSEPLGCIIHASEMMRRTQARYTFGGERPIRNVLICGAGPAGLLFTQYLRHVIGYDGLLLISEPGARRRALAENYGATTIDPTAVDLIEAVNELTHGERIHYLIEAAGVAQLFRQMPGLLRKQGTLLLYGHGHHGVDLGVLNNVQFLEPTLLAPCGASGALDADGRPQTYRRALELLSSGRISVSGFITHRYHTLAEARQAFTRDRFAPDYIKGVVVLNQ